MSNTLQQNRPDMTPIYPYRRSFFAHKGHRSFRIKKMDDLPTDGTHRKREDEQYYWWM